MFVINFISSMLNHYNDHRPLAEVGSLLISGPFSRCSESSYESHCLAAPALFTITLMTKKQTRNLVSFSTIKFMTDRYFGTWKFPRLQPQHRQENC